MNLSKAPIRWLVDDCMKFVEREIRRGNTYDAIIMDPPSYGRGPKGEIWKMEDCIYSFLEHTTQILTPNPLFFLINSYTTGLQPAVLAYMINTLVVLPFWWSRRCLRNRTSCIFKWIGPSLWRQRPLDKRLTFPS